MPSFRPLLAPVPRLRFRTDRQTDRQTHTQDNYRNPPAHARRGLMNSSAHVCYWVHTLFTAIQAEAACGHFHVANHHSIYLGENTDMVHRKSWNSCMYLIHTCISFMCICSALSIETVPTWTCTRTHTRHSIEWHAFYESLESAALSVESADS